MLQCCGLNLLSVSCAALLPVTLEEGQGEGSLDLDCVACSCYLHHQVWKYPRRAALCSLVVWKFQSPDLSANIRPVPVQPKGMLLILLTHLDLPTHSLAGVPNITWSHCLTHFYNYFSPCACSLGSDKIVAVSCFCWWIWTSSLREWEWTFGVVVVTCDYETHDWTLLPAEKFWVSVWVDKNPVNDKCWV